MLLATPEDKHYQQQPTPENEVLIAPYDAKNIYMRMYTTSTARGIPTRLP